MLHRYRVTIELVAVSGEAAAGKRYDVAASGPGVAIARAVASYQRRPLMVGEELAVRCQRKPSLQVAEPDGRDG